MHNSKLIPVIDHPELARDPNSNAIVDIDSEAYKKYLDQKQDRIHQKARFTQLESRINSIDADLSDIKNLLSRLLEK